MNYKGSHRKNFGDNLKIANFEPGDFIHSVELYPGQGPSIARSAGSFCQIRSNHSLNSKFKETAITTESFIQDTNSMIDDKKTLIASKSYRKVRLPSGSQRLISSEAFGVSGIPEFNGFHQKPREKAGRSR
jgi:ribosomal protein L2